MFIGQIGAQRLGLILGLVGADGKPRAEISDKDCTFAFSGSQPLAASLNHPYLFKAYPELLNAKFKTFQFTNQRMAKIDKNLDIYLFAKDNEDARQILCHELQHCVQSIEGFARGASANDPNYNKVAGEVEAFNVITRINFTDEERKAKSPEDTEVPPRNQQVVYPPNPKPTFGKKSLWSRIIDLLKKLMFWK